MAPREELVSSAVNFLRDPSVSSSPVEKKIEFLKSKNLTQEEIDYALLQADGQSTQSQPPPNTPYYPPQQYQRPPPGYNYGYPPYGQWQQTPPEPPKRDWRDWFIMATVVGGASLGVYALAQRYIKPLIAPPTPPQLEQDKAAIDEQFNRAFALLDTLSQDTATLKEAEKARTEKLDTAIADIEVIVSELKAANVKREDDARRMESEVKGMKDSLPRAIDSVRDGSERQLKELSTELASLKALMSNRMSGASSSMFASQGQSTNASRPQDSASSAAGAASRNSGVTNMPSSSDVAPGSKNNVTGVNGVATTPSFATPSSSYSTASSGTAPAASSASKPSFMTNKASIPAWQMAAQNKANAASTSATSAPASPAPQQDGADAVAAMMNSSHNS